MECAITIVTHFSVFDLLFHKLFVRLIADDVHIEDSSVEVAAICTVEGVFCLVTRLCQLSSHCIAVLVRFPAGHVLLNKKSCIFMFIRVV